ncbi:MAG: hypothetical protein JW741_08930 [Sedimentisphaerales bacterium]|nr:hypothetical protein [Sedimentisphaerales bacterium]
MRSFCSRQAALRLERAPWRSSTTEEALSLLQQGPSDARLLRHLRSPQAAPAALELLSASQTDSEVVFDVVRESIRGNLPLSWSLVESLNRLPWYNGIRAFLSLPEPPLSSPSVYCFYMLARNKVFIPTDVCGELYDHYFHGLWRMLSVAKSENWCDLHPSVLAVVNLLRTHLEKPDPDRFVVYFTALLLGRIDCVSSTVPALRRRVTGPCDAPVQIVAALTLLHLDAAELEELLRELACGQEECRTAMSTLVKLAASRRKDEGHSDPQLSYG